MTLEQQVTHYKNMVKTYRYDYLTGLKQRRDFEHETMKKLQKGKEFYLTMYDVDGLHKLNRDKGYAAGDALLTQIANDIRLTKDLWELYRVGGDEFMAIHFDQPRSSILGATSATVRSYGYDTVCEMVSDADTMVTDIKISRGRRRNNVSE